MIKSNAGIYFLLFMLQTDSYKNNLQMIFLQK